MAKNPDFDIDAAHKYFSAHCFNHAWDFIEKPERSEGEADQMLWLSRASLWHWTQRKDHTAKNLSVAYWQASRVFALLKQADNARHYGKLSLQEAEQGGLDPFHRGYAFEALARAEMVAGNHAEASQYLEQAHQNAALVTDQEDKKLLLADLATIQ